MTRARGALLATALLLGVTAAVVDLRPAMAAAAPAAIEAAHGHISAPDLADRILAGDPALRVIDLRAPSEYQRLHVPTAVRAAVGDLTHQDLPRDAAIVVYSDGDGRAAQAWGLLRARGYRQVFVLREGIYEWVGRVLEPRLAADATAAERAAFARATALSRFFGGVPLSGVPRADVPSGYWTGSPRSHAQLAGAAKQAIASIRRRGC